MKHAKQLENDIMMQELNNEEMRYENVEDKPDRMAKGTGIRNEIHNQPHVLSRVAVGVPSSSNQS